MTDPELEKVAAQAATQAATEVVEQLASATEDWAVQDLTPEELAGLMQIAGTSGGMGSCQDGEDAGLGDDDHGLEVTGDGSAEG